MKIKNEKKKKKVNHHQIGGNLGIYAAHKSVTLRDESENIKKAFFFCLREPLPAPFDDDEVAYLMACSWNVLTIFFLKIYSLNYPSTPRAI
jgi:hypothetical protein